MFDTCAHLCKWNHGYEYHSVKGNTEHDIFNSNCLIILQRSHVNCIGFGRKDAKKMSVQLNRQNSTKINRPHVDIWLSQYIQSNWLSLQTIQQSNINNIQLCFDTMHVSHACHFYSFHFPASLTFYQPIWWNLCFFEFYIVCCSTFHKL